MPKDTAAAVWPNALFAAKPALVPHAVVGKTQNISNVYGDHVLLQWTPSQEAEIDRIVVSLKLLFFQRCPFEQILLNLQPVRALNGVPDPAYFNATASVGFIFFHIMKFQIELFLESSTCSSLSRVDLKMESVGSPILRVVN